MDERHMSETREYPRMIDICSHSFSPHSGAFVNEYANINVAVVSASVTFGLIEIARKSIVIDLHEVLANQRERDPAISPSLRVILQLLCLVYSRQPGVNYAVVRLALSLHYFRSTLQIINYIDLSPRFSP